MRVLIACEYSGITRDAFRRRGHDAWSADLLDTEVPGPHYKGDCRRLLNEPWDLLIAHPPCTYLSCVGNAHAKRPERQLPRQRAILFFMTFINAPIPRICVENPRGIMSTQYRKPDQYVQPYNFGHIESKLTGLWLKNLPLLTPTKVADEAYRSNVTDLIGGKNRSHERSRSFIGIAVAMAEQWGKLGPLI